MACLGLAADELSMLLNRLAATLPEVEALFETPVLSASQAEGLTAQARELILCRNLKAAETRPNRQHKEGDLKQIADQLYDAAHRDALTGVYNRRHFDEALTTAFAEAGGRRQPLSLAYLDLDNFKAINDQHGHPAGDTILTKVAATIQSYLRPTDQLARYGGEEFVVLLPGLDYAAANTVVERIRAGVAGLAITLSQSETASVTLSAGLATYRDDAYGQITATDLVHAADQALYEAKRQGRNRVVQAP
jgi:diguanylate cyclase (GGDEF)-like protein